MTTAKLIAAAVALGVLGGAGTGYAVQAEHKPAPLPPLAVPQPQYPKAHRAAQPLSAAEDDMVKTDGDLTKLLVPVPAGSRPWSNPLGDDGWFPQAEYLQQFGNPDAARQSMTDDQFRRAAVTSWVKGMNSYEVVLMQFQDSAGGSPSDWVADEANNAMANAGGPQYYTQIPDSQITGGVYAGPKILHDVPGYPYYRGEGLAIHGDIAVIITELSFARIDSKALMGVLQSQLERL